MWVNLSEKKAEMVLLNPMELVSETIFNWTIAELTNNYKGTLEGW